MISKNYALLFSGLGSQKSASGKFLYKKSCVAREIYDIAGDEIKHLCLDAGDEEMKDHYNATVSIYTSSVAQYRHFVNEYKVLPAAVAGLSLGEFSALAIADVFSFKDGLELVKKSSKLMQQMAQETPQGMVAVSGIRLPAVMEAISQCRGENCLQLAVVSGPEFVTIAGEMMAIDRLKNYLNSRKVQHFMISENVATHSDLMIKVGDKVLNWLHEMQINEPKFPVISNLIGKPHEIQSLRKNLAKMICSPVSWQKSLLGLKAMGIEQFYKISPEGTLINREQRTPQRL